MTIKKENDEENFDRTKEGLTESQYEIYISWRKKQANTLLFNYPTFIGADKLAVKMNNDVIFKFH